MKFKSIIIGLLLLCTLNFYSCSKVEEMEDKGGKVTDDAKDKDVVTSPSRANDVESFDYAIENSWIVIVERDLEIDKEVTLSTGFKNSNSEEASRVLVIFSKDEAGNVKDLYTLTVPKLTIVDKGAKVEGGTLKGDLYVESNDITLQHATIDGNVYFKNEEAKNSFIIDKDSKVTGTMEIK